MLSQNVSSSVLFLFWSVHRSFSKCFTNIIYHCPFHTSQSSGLVVLCGFIIQSLIKEEFGSGSAAAKTVGKFWVPFVMNLC